MRNMITMVLWAGAGALPLPLHGQLASDQRAALSRVVEEAAADGFSGSVLVAAGNEVFRRQAGDAIRETLTPISARTVFDIGSVSKQFTRAAVLLLMDRGELILEDTIGDVFPDAPADKRGITVAQLLDMEAGLHEYVDLPEEMGDFARLDRSAALSRILNQELLFEPGSQRAYSNSGYTLLALMIERITGQDYTAFLRDALLNPAGLDRTGFYHEQHRWNETDVARGYDAATFGEVNSPYFWPSMQWALAGNGGMVASPDELLQWIHAVRTGGLLSDSAYVRLYSGSPPTGPRQGERPVVLYAGANDFGFETVVMELFDEQGVIIVSSNNGANTVQVAAALAAVMVGDAVDLSMFFDRGEADAASGDATWGLPDSPRGLAGRQVLSLIAAGNETAVHEFIDDALAPSFREQFPLDEHRAVLGDIQRELARPELVGARPTGPYGMEMMVRGSDTGTEIRITIRVESAPPHRIVELQIGN